MEYQNFDCEIAEGCATVSMIGPGSPQLADLHDEFVDLFLRLQEDRAVRVILFTDGDHAFELHHLQDEVAEAQIEGGGLEILAAQEEVSRKIVTLLGESTKPVLAATRGDVRDLGLGFFLAADIRLASTKAAFTCQNLTTGLIAGWGLTHTLPQLIGPGRSLDFLWSHRTIGGDEAARIGLVDRLFDDAVWEQELDTYIQQLVQLPQPAVHLTKLAVDQAATMDYTTMLSVEWESQQQCWASLETSEGLAAWRENRPPVLAVSIEDEEE
ncbi:MAG: enoyl-CoA hydratase/isomerase family protein [Candidatus Krumholzibacteria bacterium]|nr:enoyl-CoA hydratase/isomerase family protein [Candidatus Krumholzibacteria bacterium]